jgi:hypothetical protein
MANDSYPLQTSMDRDLDAGVRDPARSKLNPYVRGEIYYDSRYDMVSRTALIGGSAFPITRHFELERYFEHQNDSGGSSNRTVNAVGVVANLYF